MYGCLRCQIELRNTTNQRRKQNSSSEENHTRISGNDITHGTADIFPKAAFSHESIRDWVCVCCASKRRRLTITPWIRILLSQHQGSPHRQEDDRSLGHCLHCSPSNRPWMQSESLPTSLPSTSQSWRSLESLKRTWTLTYKAALPPWHPLLLTSGQNAPIERGKPEANAVPHLGESGPVLLCPK